MKELLFRHYYHIKLADRFLHLLKYMPVPDFNDQYDTDIF